MLVAVAPVGELPGGLLGILLAGLAGLSLVLVAVVVSSRRYGNEGPMSPPDQAKVEAHRRQHKSRARYYLWVAAMAAVLLVVVGLLALLNS